MADHEMGRARRKPHKHKKRRKVEGAPPRKPRRAWSKPVRMGDNIEIRTKAPYRAALMEIQPGLYVVGELRVDALDFGASTRAVTREILHAVDKGLDAVFPKRKAKKARASAEARQIRDSERRERELRQREAKLRETEERLRQLETLQTQQTQQRHALPPPRRAAIKREAARWLVEDDMWDQGLAGETVRYEEPNTLEYLMWRLHQDDE